MNRRELQTVRQEAQRFIKDAKIILLDDGVVKIEFPFQNSKEQDIYIFVTKRKKTGKFSLLLPVESAGISNIPSTLALLQPLLKTYGLILSPESVIMEDSNIPLHGRIRNITQAIIGIDCIRRLWQIQYGSSNASESEDNQSTSNTT